MYADNQQIYLSFKPSKAGDKENCIRRLEMCISEIGRMDDIEQVET